jgi:hypothetical protein
MSKPRPEAFENVKDQVGYCGIWCGSCIVGNGALAELTTRYESILDAYGIKQWAPSDFDHAGFARELDMIRRFGSCPGCLKGGGRDNCEMRACAVEKGLKTCVGCSAGSGCEPRETLETMRSGAVAAGLFVLSDKEERDRALTRWKAEIPRRWPSSVLFIEDWIR